MWKEKNSIMMVQRVSLETGSVVFPSGRSGFLVFSVNPPNGPALVASLRLPPFRGLVLLNGGASGMSPEETERVRPLVTALVRIAEEEQIAIIDGGTQAGAVQVLGEARTAVGATSPLIGVCPAARVSWPGGPNVRDLRPLEPNHTHFVLTPGDQWGDETETMFALAATLACQAPSVAVLINGGLVARREVMYNLAQRREIIIVDKSGRLADIIAGVVKGTMAAPDEEIATIARCGQLTLFDRDQNPAVFSSIIRQKLFGEEPHERFQQI